MPGLSQDQAVSRPSNVKSHRDTTGHNENKPAGQDRSAVQLPQACLPGHEKSGTSPLVHGQALMSTPRTPKPGPSMSRCSALLSDGQETILP
jgi:hypothetical protein